jgi:hypothetical protein
MSEATYIIGDVFDVMATLPDNSFDMVMTSPPFLALRSYLPADHPDKDREIGSEPDPAGFLDTLLELTAEWRRVLAPHGSIAVELGDTYSGSGGDNNLWTSGYSGGRYGNDTKKPAGQGVKRDTTANRPAPSASDVGLQYLDNTLDADGKSILWNGTAWVDATGAVV